VAWSSEGAGGGFLEGNTIERGERTWKVMMKNTAGTSALRSAYTKVTKNTYMVATTRWRL
jgi:hypothetical protein